MRRYRVGERAGAESRACRAAGSDRPSRPSGGQLWSEPRCPAGAPRRIQHLETDDQRAPRRDQRRHNAAFRVLDRRADRREDAAAIDDGSEGAGLSRVARRRSIVGVERRYDERRIASPEKRDLMIRIWRKLTSQSGA